MKKALTPSARSKAAQPASTAYDQALADLVAVVEAARGVAARSVNSVMTAAGWLIGRRLVEFEQHGDVRAEYGKEVVASLAAELTRRFGRGYGKSRLFEMRAFYLDRPDIFQTVSGKSKLVRAADIFQTVSGKSLASKLPELWKVFPLSWSHYVLLQRRAKTKAARDFYEAEALRGGWSVRQLARQIDSQFHERTALSRNKAAMLAKGGQPLAGDDVSPEEAIKDPFVLEFLGLKDEYSESDLEEALIRNLEQFLLELGEDFCFVARQKRLRIGDEWYRVDLVFFHRRLRCLVVIDLKVGRFTHADAGQMAMYLQYAKEHWTKDGESAPVGLILCSSKDRSVAHYALAGLKERVIASEYLPVLPSEEELAAHLAEARRLLAMRGEP